MRHSSSFNTTSNKCFWRDACEQIPQLLGPVQSSKSPQSDASVSLQDFLVKCEPKSIQTQTHTRRRTEMTFISYSEMWANNRDDLGQPPALLPVIEVVSH